MTGNEPLVALLVAAALVAAALATRTYLRRRRLRTALAMPFPEAWRRTLARRVPLYRRLPAELRPPLERATRAFLERIEFVGCGGLTITEEMRLVIATQACLLTFTRAGLPFPGLYSVLVYPDEFLVEESHEDEAGVVTEGTSTMTGQAIETDRIVLSWRDVLERGDESGAYNVVLHEFAHYLDHEIDGALSAAPAGRTAAEWHRVLDREYRALCDAVEREQPTLIDPYGAEDPAEFFAVATETFFELPHEMERRHPALYGELRRFYALDPARW